MWTFYTKFVLIIKLFTIHHATSSAYNENCPVSCTCLLQHWKDLNLNEWLNKNDPSSIHQDHSFFNANDAFNYDDPSPEENPIMKIAICLTQPEENYANYLKQLPDDLQVITIIQGSSKDNITLKASYFQHFKNLVVLDIKGTNPYDGTLLNPMLFLLDVPLTHVKYINFQDIIPEHGSYRRIYSETPNVRYEQKLSNINSVTFIQQESNDTQIVPYNVYVEQQKRSKSPSFAGYENLIFLRIFNGRINEIYWEMFEGLQNLKYLYLEKNELRFIPEFAFYGVPKLEFLSLSKNNLLDIQLTDLSGLLDLQYLDLTYNNFSQLSELSFPPFPKLKVADFRNNPISIVFPNTFEVMNTTNCIILGNSESSMVILPNSFVGLNMLEILKLYDLKISILKQELLSGMPKLKELVLSGNIKSIEYDAFINVQTLEKLILKHCALETISMDAFYGLKKLSVLDLSHNKLTMLSPGLFDYQASIKEIYLQNNLFKELPKGLFYKINAKLIRLTENPWNCTCNLRYWNPAIVNKIKILEIKMCDKKYDKGIMCNQEAQIKYVYDNRVAPRCQTPETFLNWGVFHVLRKQLRCYQQYNTKLRKYKDLEEINENKYEILSNNSVETAKNLNLPKSIETIKTNDTITNASVPMILNEDKSSLKELKNTEFENKIDNSTDEQIMSQTSQNTTEVSGKIVSSLPLQVTNNSVTHNQNQNLLKVNRFRQMHNTNTINIQKQYKKIRKYKKQNSDTFVDDKLYINAKNDVITESTSLQENDQNMLVNDLV